MSRKVVLISIFGGIYDHFFNPPPSFFTKGGKKEILPFSKGELEGICTIF